MLRDNLHAPLYAAAFLPAIDVTSRYSAPGPSFHKYRLEPRDSFSASIKFHRRFRVPYALAGLFASLFDLMKKYPITIIVMMGENHSGICAILKPSTSMMTPSTKSEYIAPFFK